jgi:hypothetical protein
VVDENATAELETQTRQSKRNAALWEEEDTSFKTVWFLSVEQDCSKC